MRLLVTAPYHEKALQALKEQFGEIIYRPWKLQERAYNEKELISLLGETQAEALITEHDEVTSAVVEAFPDLRFIGVCRGTPSNVATTTATAKGIPVFNTPARNAQAVAEMFIANLINLMRNTLAGISWLEGENWAAGAHTSYLQFKGNEIAGKTIGMVGFGAVGQTIANLVRHFPADIQYFDPFYTSEDLAYKKLSLEELFETSDVVSIHLPVNKETEGMIDEKLISLMKKDAIFVNTARAVVVKREALLYAIENNMIRGAILDVFDHEPPDETDYRLIHHPHVLATPHIAGATFEVEDHHADIMNNNLKSFYIDGKHDIRQLVNKEHCPLKPFDIQLMTPQEAYLIADIGTGNVRVAVAGSNGNILGVASGDMHYEKDYSYPESIYFDANALWEQIQNLGLSALQQAGNVTITAITATSQREGIVAIDKAGHSLIGMPNIDHRGREWEDITPDKHEIYKLTGRYPTSLFSALKLVGLRNRRPEIWQHVTTFLSISDWAQFRFSGVAGYEHSQASETLLYDVKAGQWSPQLCAAYQIDSALLPQLKQSGTILGTILPEIAVSLGISDKALVVVGGSDTQLAIMSMQPSIDDIVIVSGTTTPIIKIADNYVTDELERTWTSRHTDETSFLLEANAGVTGLNYQRLKEIFYPNEPYEIIEQEVGAVKDLHCVAALGSLLAGEKTPLIRGGFVFNTPVSHLLGRGHFVWATLWDIACSISENYHFLCEVTSHDQDYVWACGGGVQSRILRQFIANLLGKKVMIRNNYRQASAAGGMMVCNNALGKETSIPGTLDIVYPQRSEQHDAWYQEWKSVRAAFKSAL